MDEAHRCVTYHSPNILSEDDRATRGNCCFWSSSSSIRRFEALSLQRISRRISTIRMRPGASGKLLGRRGLVTRRRSENGLLAYHPKSLPVRLIAAAMPSASSSRTGRAAPMTIRLTHQRGTLLLISALEQNRLISLAHFDLPLVEAAS